VTNHPRPAACRALLVAAAVAAAALPARLPAQAPPGPAAVLLKPEPLAPEPAAARRPADGRAVWRGVAGENEPPLPPETVAPPMAPNPSGPMVWVVRPTGEVVPAPGYGVPPTSAPVEHTGGRLGGGLRNLFNAHGSAGQAVPPSAMPSEAPLPAPSAPISSADGTVARTENGRSWRWYGYGAPAAGTEAPPGAGVYPSPTASTGGIHPTALAALTGPSLNPPAPTELAAPLPPTGTPLGQPLPGPAAATQAPVRMPSGRSAGKAVPPPPDTLKPAPTPHQPVTQALATMPAGQPGMVVPAVRQVSSDPLADSVLRVCAGLAWDVAVGRRTDGSVVIRGKVRSSAHAEPLANRLAGLAELGPYKVDFEFQVTP
jgi:hypothetical protein